MIENYYDNHPLINDLSAFLQDNSPQHVHLKGLTGSSPALLFLAAIKKTGGNHIIILPEKEKAAYFFTDLTVSGSIDNLFFFPSSYKRSVQYGQTDEANIVMRTKTLEQTGTRTENATIVTYPEALIEKVITRENITNHIYEIRKGDKIDNHFLQELLSEYGFTETDFVYSPGQFAVRGSILDVFSFSSALPYRIDFFGNEVESVRSFDVDTQLSVEMLEDIRIIPNIQWEQGRGDSRIPFTEYCTDAHIWVQDMDLSIHQMNEVYEKAVLNSELMPAKEGFLLNGDNLRQSLAARTIIEFGTAVNAGYKKLNFSTVPQIPVSKNFSMLAEILGKNTKAGYRNIIFSSGEKQVERINAIFSEIAPEISFTNVLGGLYEGFTDHDLKIAVFTDHQIFDRYYRFRLKDQFLRKESLALKELKGLNPGDYVVHVDHGVGIFGGLETIEISGKKQESVRLLFRDNDVLYVSIHSLHKISKFKGGESDAPKIYKLGTGAWQKLKQTTKSKVKDIASELIKLYAERMQEKGFRFSHDTYLQQELEASFIYEDTPDQLKSTNDVKKDMEADFPMDRLVCGDVGFGKTEIAIRAAFKAVSDSQQVAILVPTTILAFQHYNTFRERLKDFPCNINYISRLRKSSDQSQILKELEKGTIDIIIGTHKLAGKNIKFKNLGLLIIDEEQKFGVAVKEKLRQLKKNIDTLTLTATPIPRTLQFSLMGARDLSVINTPPPNRHPIITELHVFNEDIIKEAIEYELSRGGQVFFIQNRILHLEETVALVKRTVRSARVVMAHGQMEGKELEETVLSFMQGDYDVLVATSIIESGLDIPNANTIIINNAHHFGLSDLHQLRGRVGRSNKKAFCYLLAPPPELLTQDARRRVKAIEENSELGSGFNISMHDLDIRGAGNLLGAEQSGFIAEIGLETYHRILQEAVLELRENEFRDFYREKEETTSPADKDYCSDCQIDTDLQLLLPDNYISNVSERIRLYRELDNIASEEELQKFSSTLKDRFGEPPPETLELMDVVRLRRVAMKLGFEKIILRNKQMLIYFIQDQKSDYYNSETFLTILSWLQQKPKGVSMKENGGKLIMKVENVRNVGDALRLLNGIDK